MSYPQLDISSFESLPRLHHDHGYQVIVDPVLYRIGQLFLAEGTARRDGDYWDEEWSQIKDDIGALVTFFDLLILHDALPAFDYSATFNPMSAQINGAAGDYLIQDLHVRGDVYSPIREAVVAQLQDRMAAGPFVRAEVATQIPDYLERLGYQWQPDIVAIEPALPDEQSRTVARFLVGHLLFAGYAQMSGLPHVLSPRRGRLVAAAGLPVNWGVPATEAAVWRSVGERVANAEGWRRDDLPWTPSFLPYLLQRTQKQRGGPETLLKNALELRNKRSVRKYREMRRIALGPDDTGDNGDARRALEDAASGVAKDLAVDRGDLTFTQSFVLGAGPAAVGYVGGAGLGMLIGGPPGAFLGGLAGAIAPEMLKPASDRLWGWIIDRLPFVSARKLLSTSARAEAEVGASLAASANEIWRRGYV